jgi:predicted CoA-binding protein
MNHDTYPDRYIRGILMTVQSIAMVGISSKPNRPSFFAFKYLLERGYNMIAVNPREIGGAILGRKVYANLGEIPQPVDMVDIFRAPRFAAAIVEEAVTLRPRPRVIWMQLGIRDDAAAAIAEAAGLKVVMNRCPKIEYGRLSSPRRKANCWVAVSSACRLTGRPWREGPPRRPNELKRGAPTAHSDGNLRLHSLCYAFTALPERDR